MRSRPWVEPVGLRLRGEEGSLREDDIGQLATLRGGDDSPPVPGAGVGVVALAGVVIVVSPISEGGGEAGVVLF